MDKDLQCSEHPFADAKKGCYNRRIDESRIAAFGWKKAK